ncbi:MAG: NADP-dependent 3-hydroxy acid dehydrogenase YdfG [Bacteroidia bacterium]|jgi:NADP-dependent 3-hydroxy acid dehydrogenase YdfG
MIVETNSINMDKKTVLVTGGTRGIGKAIVMAFANQGCNIISCGRDQEKLETLRQELLALNLDYFVESCDVRDRDKVNAFFNKATDKFKTIDIVVNNAGVFHPGRIQDESDDMFASMMETNINATYYFSKLAIPFLKASDKGHLFNICSTASITPYKNGGTYCISKYAQYGLTKVLREELKPDGVRVTAVLPGATRTDSWNGTELPDSRFINVESIATMILNTYNLPQQTVVEDILIRPMLGDID